MKILFATDAGEPAGRAASVIEALADRTRAEITALTVTRFDPHSPELLRPGGEAVLTGEQHAEAVAAGTAQRLRDQGLRADARTAIGRPAKRIVELATDEAYELVVLGAGNHTFLGRLLLGSTSTYVLHHAPCAILVVHDAPRNPDCVRVLVATDGSREAWEAARTFASFADPGRCAVTVMSVAAVPALVSTPPAVPVAPLIPPVGGRADVVKRYVEEARHAAEATARLLEDAGFRIETTMVDGSPRRTIVEEAQGTNHDLTVVGCRGLGQLPGALLGSVSHAVARQAAAALVGWAPFTGTARPLNGGSFPS